MTVAVLFNRRRQVIDPAHAYYTRKAKSRFDAIKVKARQFVLAKRK